MIQNLLRHFDLKLTHNRSDHWSDSLNLIGTVVKLLQSKEDALSILQIGANDGSANDPLASVIAKGVSRAVLLEPQPAVFERLSARYSENPEVQCVQAALGTRDGEAALYYAKFPRDTPDAFTRIATFDKKVINKHLKRIRLAGGTIGTMTVPTITLRTLLAGFSLPNPHVIGIDTEGFDAKAVSLCLEAGLNPEILFYEHAHVSGAEDAKCLELLKERDYLLARVNRDTLAIKSSTWQSLFPI